MFCIKYFVSFIQAAQNTVLFNEKPSREFWDTICTSVCSVSFANLKCNFAENPLLVRAACDCDSSYSCWKVTRGLTNPAATAADANPSVPSHSPLASEPEFLSHFIAHFQNFSTMLYTVLYFLILKP